ncbi:ComEC/Rec2 family competence protein [Pectobacterium aroidearum]|uniref:ComEC/Rec2 family competence protein n=1 Tax=Pectobacterium aroidearum TaxID=1201031 RepID=UPI0032EE5994
MTKCIEIDFLPVGKGEHSGDAITVHWTENGQSKVMVYDGGTKDYGEAIVNHVRKHYGVDFIDYVVNSHPDNDHAGGLTYVIKNIEVGELWMHRPWEYSEVIRDFFHDGRMTDNSLAERLKQKMAAAYALEQAAIEKGIPIYEPFADSTIGIFTVLSPLRARYVYDLIPNFSKSPEPKKPALSQEGIAESLGNVIQEAVSALADAWNTEYLPETVETSAENESSAILFSRFNGKGYLFTGDAGIESLREAAVYAAASGIDLPKEVNFVQIPHHGGRHNVSTETLNLIVGEPLANGTKPFRTALVSASRTAPKHPKKVVTNAFIRRGFKVAQTKGKQIHHRYNLANREGWVSATLVPFYEETDE